MGLIFGFIGVGVLVVEFTAPSGEKTRFTSEGGIGLAFLPIGIGLLVGQFRRPRQRVAPEVTDGPTRGLKP